MLRVMKRKLRFSTLYRFFGVFVLAFAALVAVWGFVAPVYNVAVAHVASPLFRLVESPDVTAVRPDGPELWIYRTDTGGTLRPFSYFDPYIYFGVVPLAALLIATPAGLAKWGQRLGLGLTALFAAHVIYLVGSVELTYAAIGLAPIPGGEGGRPFLDWAQVLLRVGWQAAPVVIYVALSFGFWRGALHGVWTPREVGVTGEGGTLS